MEGLRPIVLFAARLPPLAGGVEVHAGRFIDHFRGHPRFPLAAVVTRSPTGHDMLAFDSDMQRTDPRTLLRKLDPAVVFFNDGYWIEDLRALRDAAPRATFFYRTGGNEILKAPLERTLLADHLDRQHFWVDALADTIDVLVTNSAFTEDRLRAIGVSCPFLRCVGGADVTPHTLRPRVNDAPILCCAARLVPYKNHALLLDVIAELLRRGRALALQLAGDGPLLPALRAQVTQGGLARHVHFLGELPHLEVCREIALADGYIQLSGDVVTDVPGGSYVHAEGMGRSILEALSAGTFVIAGRSGALPEIVTAGRGILIDLETPEAMADAIEPWLTALPRSAPLDIYRWADVFATYEQAWITHASTRRH